MLARLVTPASARLLSTTSVLAAALMYYLRSRRRHLASMAQPVLSQGTQTQVCAPYPHSQHSCR